MNPLAKFALAPFSGLYALATNIRRASYRKGILRTHRLDVPVISVGNLTVGGSGKTPLVEWVANELAGKGWRVCILTRGYKRADEKKQVVVSDGKEILSNVEAAGDEPFMLANHLLNKAAVVSDSDRVSAAHWAMAELKPDVFLLDDGFQHLQIARDLDVVVIDASKPWANDWLVPAGRLREGPAQLRRADCVIVMRAEHARREQLLTEIARFVAAPVFFARLKLCGLTVSENQAAGHDAGDARNTPAAAFCGIGNPASFFAQLNEAGYNVVQTVTLPDHHAYTQSDLDQISGSAVAKGAKLLLTTAKDEVKLRSLTIDLPCYVVSVALEVENAENFIQLLEKALRKD